MNIAPPKRIVMLGFMSHFPVAGVAWQTVHYLVGFQRLGYEVFYVEAHGCTPSKLMQDETDDGAARAAAYIGRIMDRFDLGGRWAYHSIYESRCFGMSQTQLSELYRSAALIINLHGSHLPSPELSAGNRLVYLGTDPVDIEIDVFNGNREAIDYLTPHSAFFTYGENIGKPDCLVPAPQQFKFFPTRQPVVMDFWEGHAQGEGRAFTTIGNWRQPWREVRFKGEVYRWSKHFEFLKIIDLPGRVNQPLELALSSYNEQDQKLLETKGWRVRPAMDFSRDLDPYRQYICDSRGEFTVAKDQNVRLRSGWFSDRAVTYLAAGRPVITQETGFSDNLPTGEGLFAFSTPDEIVAAIETINGDYERHRRAALGIAHEHLSFEVVLTRMLRDLGLAPGLASRSCGGNRAELPAGLVLAPVGRWPTRLPEETVRIASALPVPLAIDTGAAARKRTSVVVVTHNGLAYTKMCFASLLRSGWSFSDELIVVDNASTDGTAEYLRELSRLNPFVRVLCNKANMGFAAGNNLGLKQATGDLLILLNNDTLVLPGWIDGLAKWLEDKGVGMVGPVTNRTCNEAQIDAPYRTLRELGEFVAGYTRAHQGQSCDIRMLAMFCVAMRRDVFEKVGPLDEQFEIGMFEDDDYARRVREAGFRMLCAEDVFVHHFGQASLGELCLSGEYDRVLEANRRRFEAKWGVNWQPHGRRITPEYQLLRLRIQAEVARSLPVGSTVAVISKGDEELLKLEGKRGWHFPRGEGGHCANIYPADGAQAVAQVEQIRANGARFLLIPKPAFWWLEHYGELKDHLDRNCRLAVSANDTCLIFDLEGGRV